MLNFTISIIQSSVQNAIKEFRDVFKKVTGIPSIEYRNRYNKMAAG
ncbi:MAG: hypothetical protein H7339_10190 [Arcicella sp.]|nr:hypothetical protein [Arcicella sp.]